MRTLTSDLNDRKLRFDGVSEIEPDQLARFLLLGVPPKMLRVKGLESDIAEFNTQVSEYDQILPVFPEPVNLNMGWQLPEEYQNIDLNMYMSDIFMKHMAGKSQEYLHKAIERIAYELEEVEKRGMVEFMRTVIFIIDELKRNNVLWGVGRGSSCACYLLFLIGLHVVDCVMMDVSAEEFFHD